MKLRLLFLFFFVALALPATAAGATTTTQTAPKPLCTISAKPSSVYLGQTITLTWDSQYATGGTITSLGSVPPSGIQGVIPTAYTSTYVGSFTGSGGVGTCYVTVGIMQGNGGDGGIDGAGGSAVTTPLSPTSPTAVPAGTVSKPTGLIPCSGTDCQACHLAGLAQNIINWLVGISIPLAAAMFAYAGIMYFTAGTTGALGKYEDAHKIFKNVGFGFLIVICAWLGIQTILKTVLSPGFYQSWNTIQCIDNGLRPTNKTVGQLLSLLPGLNTVVPATNPAGSAYGCVTGTLVNNQCKDSSGNIVGSPTLMYTAANSGYTCADGLYLAGNRCVDERGVDSGDPVPLAPPQNGTGDCSAASLAQDFDDPGDVAAMSCVLPRESGAGCNPNLGSKVDVGTDGKSVSWGQAQINISANKLTCDEFNNGQTVDCTKAFNAAYTGKNHNVYVTDQALYNTCVTMATNVGCNREAAQEILNRQGICAWGAAKACNVGC